MPGENVWMTQKNQALAKIGRKPIAWMDRKLSPQIPERYRGGNPTEHQVAQMQKLYGRGLTIENVAKAVEFSVSVVERAIKQEIS